MKGKLYFVFLSLLAAMSCFIMGCSAETTTGAQNSTGEAAEYGEESLVRVSADAAHLLSQEADGITYTISGVELYPRISAQSAQSEGETAAPYLMKIEVDINGANPNLLVERADGILSFANSLESPLELVNKKLQIVDDASCTYTYFYTCEEVADTVYYQPAKYSLLSDESTVVADIDTLEAEVQYDEGSSQTRLVLEYEAGDLPYIPRIATITAAKNSPGEASGTAVSYEAFSMNNYRNEQGDFIGGAWLFIIPGKFEPTAYYDMLFWGYETELAPADVMEIPLQRVAVSAGQGAA